MHTTADKHNLHLHNNVKFFLAQIVYPLIHSYNAYTSAHVWPPLLSSEQFIRSCVNQIWNSSPTDTDIGERRMLNRRLVSLTRTPLIL